MNKYFTKKFQQGLEFQDHVMDVLHYASGISLYCYSSRKFQKEKGENRSGFEIKYDSKYADTDNLYIETEDIQSGKFVPSGIYAEDNSWLYIIGNYSEFFILSKKMMQNLATQKNYHKVDTPTSKGFLFPKEEAQKYCLHKYSLIDE